MSMTVEQRRVELIDQQTFPAGCARLVKASSRYDRRYRYWVVEILRPGHVGHELEEWLWKPVQNWAVGRPQAESEARAAYATAWLTLRALAGAQEGSA